jgi:hypothetical protein
VRCVVSRIFSANAKRRAKASSAIRNVEIWHRVGGTRRQWGFGCVEIERLFRMIDTFRRQFVNLKRLPPVWAVLLG